MRLFLLFFLPGLFAGAAFLLLSFLDQESASDHFKLALLRPRNGSAPHEILAKLVRMQMEFNADSTTAEVSGVPHFVLKCFCLKWPHSRLDSFTSSPSWLRRGAMSHETNEVSCEVLGSACCWNAWKVLYSL